MLQAECYLFRIMSALMQEDHEYGHALTVRCKFVLIILALGVSIVLGLSVNSLLKQYNKSSTSFPGFFEQFQVISLEVWVTIWRVLSFPVLPALQSCTGTEFKGMIIPFWAIGGWLYFFSPSHLFLQSLEKTLQAVKYCCLTLSFCPARKGHGCCVV